MKKMIIYIIIGVAVAIRARGVIYIIKNKNRKFYRVDANSWRFRNIPKTKFIKNSFKSKVVNKNITLIFGQLIR